MEWHGYQLSTFADEDIEEILILISALWGNDTSFNRDYFTWKHRKNPLLTGNIGIAAKYAGKVVGFLGYVPAEYQTGDSRFSILQQCDTVVHPEHRGKGLFSAMSKMGMNLHAGEYSYIVNFTSNYMTAGGLLKIGWQPLAPVRYLRKFSYVNLIKNRLSPESQTALTPGRFGDIEVSDKLPASGIFETGIPDCYARNKIHLKKTTEYIEWRLAYPRAKYVCLYILTGNDIDAYIVLKIKSNHAHIFDYGQKADGPGVPKLLAFLIKKAGLSSISFFDTTTPDELKPFLRKNHFQNFRCIDRIRHGRSYNIPIIIRPVVENYAEDDWRIGGVDTRDISNWHITEISFD
jgi:GNAT superfamily N-acetyltransferase